MVLAPALSFPVGPPVPGLPIRQSGLGWPRRRFAAFSRSPPASAGGIRAMNVALARGERLNAVDKRDFVTLTPIAQTAQTRQFLQIQLDSEVKNVDR